jgi:molybdenum-dependent DNA-binding transcriptional regulator ModE
VPHSSSTDAPLPHRRPDPSAIPPHYARLIAELAMSDGNIRIASERAGISYVHARRLVAQNPAIREAVEAARAQVTSRMQRWVELAAEAQRTVQALLASESDQVRLSAAKEILDRAEGKPRQAVDVSVEEQEDAPDSITMRYAVALTLSRGIGLAQALEEAERRPEKVKLWLSDEAVK